MIGYAIFSITVPNSFAQIDWTKAEREIKCLKVNDFKGVPAAVIDKVAAHGCEVPQVYGAKQPVNVISGHFTSKNFNDWAIL